MLEFLAEFWRNHTQLVWVLAIGSVVMLVVSALTIPIIIVKLPDDFYTRDNPRPLFVRHPLVRIVFLLSKNAVGLILLVAGVMMLFLPGQGILTLLAGLALVDFPGKRAVEMRILRSNAVLRSANWLRRRAGKQPLRLPD